MPTKKKVARKPKQPTVLVAYKGFDKDFKCQQMQYAVGQAFEHKGEVARCRSGLHACENPLDVLAYYPVGTNRYALVEASGALDREENGDSKFAAARLDIKAELRMPDLIAAAVKFVFASVKASKKCAATTGSWANAATTGERANAATTGKHAIAAAFGLNAFAKANKNGAIVLVNRENNGNLRYIFAAKVGENGIKPDLWYGLDDAGQPYEVSAQVLRDRGLA